MGSRGMLGHGMCGRRVRRDRRVRQVHRPRPGRRGSAGRSRPCSFPFLLQPLFAELVQLRDLLAHLLSLGFADTLEP